MQMANSVEYRTIIQCIGELKNALIDDLYTISGELLAAGLINDENETALRNTSIHPASRVADLVQYVRNKVKVEPEMYDVFIQTLMKRKDDHQSILKILNQKYKELATEEKERLIFSVDMSDDDFVAFLKIKGVPDADCSKLIENGVGPKVFVKLTEGDIDDHTLCLFFGGKVALKQILREIKGNERSRTVSETELAIARQKVKKVEDISNTALDSEKHKQELSTVDQLLKHNQKEMKAKNDSLDHLQEQLRDACCVRDTLQSKLTKINEQLERESANKSFLEWECLAKTQQVKQYKKQVDHQRMQLQESNAMIEQYQVQLEQCKHELASCQKDLKKREKNEPKNVQYESELSTLKLEVSALKKEKADMEVELRQKQIGAIALGDQLEKEKAELYQKYICLRNRYDVMFQHNGLLVAVLVQNNITVPNAKTPLPRPRAPSSPYQEQVIHDGRQYNRQNDPNKSDAAQPGIKAPHDQQLNYGEYQQTVGGVASPLPSMKRAGESPEDLFVVAHVDNHVHPHKNLQEINLPTVAYNQGQPNTYPDDNQPSGCEERVPVNYPQSQYGQPQPPNATPATVKRVRRENALIKGINTEIHNVAAGVERQVDRNPEMDPISPQAPFDPNLICPMCRLQCRIGEIQKYRKHVKHCKGS